MPRNNNNNNNNNLRNVNVAGLREVNLNTLSQEVFEKGIGNRGSPTYMLSENVKLPMKGPVLSNIMVAPPAPKKAFGTLPRFAMRKSRKARKTRRGGGNDKEQIQHALSQLKRFAERASEGKPFKTLQFGYNLGRLQEMVDGGKPGMHKIWWQPVEPLVEAGEWSELSAKIDEFQARVGIEYDEATIRKE